MPLFAEKKKNLKAVITNAEKSLHCIKHTQTGLFRRVVIKKQDEIRCRLKNNKNSVQPGSASSFLTSIFFFFLSERNIFLFQQHIACLSHSHTHTLKAGWLGTPPRVFERQPSCVQRSFSLFPQTLSRPGRELLWVCMSS